MRVLHVITRLIQGGAQQNTVISCAAQVRAGHEVHLAYGPIYGPEGSLLEEAQRSGAVLHECSSMRRAVLPWHDYAIHRQLRRLIREVQPDLVHTHSSKAGIVGRTAAWAEKSQETRRFGRSVLSVGVRPVVVHTVHGLPFHERQHALVHWLYVSLERFAAKRCDHLIAITPAMVEAFERHRIASRERFTVIPSGVELSRFDTTLDRAEAKRSFGLPADEPVVGLIARLDPLKGHRDLLTALPAIIDKVPKARVLLVGDGFDAAGIRAAVSALPSGLSERVSFAGYVAFEGMSRAYRACDVVALPSYQEGQSRVLVEALWCGCAVVGYDVGGIPSVCVDRVTGLLAPVGDTRKLGEAVIELLCDHEAAEAMIERGRSHVAEHFSAERMNRELLGLYERLMTAGGA